MMKLALHFMVALACVAYAVAAPMPQLGPQADVQNETAAHLSPAANAALGSDVDVLQGAQPEGIESPLGVGDSEADAESDSESSRGGRQKRNSRRRSSGRFGSFQRRKFKLGGFRKSGKHGN